MATNHDAVAAVPTTTSAANKSLIRSLFVKRMPYALTDGEDSRNLVAVDPNTAAVIEDILYLGRVFHYDSADHSTAHDGTTCLVSFEGNRYKLTSSSADVIVYSVIDSTHTAPIASPAPVIGQRYLVATGGTGAWSGHDGQIAVYTARGWEFVTLATGRMYYDEATDIYYHKKASGTLVAGFGTQSMGANVIAVSSIIGKPVRWIVVNQTTNTPPTSPSIGDAYVIGSVPTGAWAGNAAKIAICEAGTAFTIYTPRNGEQIFDQSLNVEYVYSSALSTWLSSNGGVIGSATSGMTTSGSTSTGGAGNYTYSNTSAPTLTTIFTKDDAGVTYSARKTGARLKFTYQFASGSSITQTLALYRDSETTALDWANIAFGVGSNGCSGAYVFEISASDTSSHTYKAVLQANGGGSPSAPVRRRLSVDEYS